MRTFYLLLSITLLSLLLGSCSNDDNDREKIVEVTLYPETTYGIIAVSDIWTDAIVFSDNDENTKQKLINLQIEGDCFEYDQGYEYKYKARKVWMKNPPQDGSFVKYVFMELLSKNKAITEDSETEVELFVSGEIVLYVNAFSLINIKNVIDNALLVENTTTKELLALTSIEGFDFEEGYQYTLSAKKVTTAEPYSVKYVLIEVLSKEKMD